MSNRTRFLILSDFKNRPSSKKLNLYLGQRLLVGPGGLVEFLQLFHNQKVILPSCIRSFKGEGV